jgi:hypothetical protein
MKAITVQHQFHKFNRGSVRLALMSALAAGVLLAADGTATNESQHTHEGHQEPPAKLVQMVRDATLPFVDVNAATAANYQPFLGCVTGPDHGAMGVHYVNGDLVGDGEIDASHPEALIYEPSGGAMRLVGVEFIVDAATWMAHHDSPPVLEGQNISIREQPEPFRLGCVLRIARLGVAGQPERCIR